MCNNFKSNQNEEIKSEGILIFKDTMEYLVDGILTAEQYAELTRMIYATRWGDGVNEKEIKDKLLLGIWKTLKHTIKKSARNARYRENNQNKKSVLQEEYKNENKAILTPQNNEDDNLYQPIEESGLNSLKMPVNTEFDIPTVEIKEPEIEDDFDMFPTEEDNYHIIEQDVQFDNYSDELYNLLESKDMDIIRNILERAIDYNYFNKTQYEDFYRNGYNKINEIYSQYINCEKDIKDFKKYCEEYNTAYYNNVKNNNNTNISNYEIAA